MNFDQRVDPRVGICPCKGCNERDNINRVCHSECERYISWTERRLKIKEHDRKIKDQEAAANSYVVEKALKNKEIARARRGSRRNDRK